MAADTRPRGLLVPAWRAGRATEVVLHGRFAGMTPDEVATRVGCSTAYARASLLDALEPEPDSEPPPAPRGRKLTAASLAKRRAAGVPEDLIERPVAEIARALNVSEKRVTNAIYRGGSKLS